jgi:hypothetical protein
LTFLLLCIHYHANFSSTLMLSVVTDVLCGGVEFLLIIISPPHLSTCSNQGSANPTSYGHVSFVSSMSWGERRLFRFVDIDGIVDYHYLSFLSIIYLINNSTIIHELVCKLRVFNLSCGRVVNRVEKSKVLMEDTWQTHLTNNRHI